MDFIKYPDSRAVAAASEKKPLLLVSLDGRTAVISPIDDAVEHHILLAKAGLDSINTSV